MELEIKEFPSNTDIRFTPYCANVILKSDPDSTGYYMAGRFPIVDGQEMIVGKFNNPSFSLSLVYDHKTMFIAERDFYLNLRLVIEDDEVIAECFIGYLDKEKRCYAPASEDIPAITGSISEITKFVKHNNIEYVVTWIWDHSSTKYNCITKYMGERGNAARIFEQS
jgi:hypothetical protein